MTNDADAPLNIQPGAGFFEGLTHVLPVRVYYEDTDAAGIVYYANYLRFMERGRTDMLRLLDIDQISTVNGGENRSSATLFVVRRCEVEYLRPARLNEGLHVYTSLDKVGGASVFMAQKICRDGVPLIDARVRIACVAVDGRPKRMASKTREIFRSLTLDNEGNLRNAG